MAKTKADLERRIRDLEDAFDRLMASHRDCTSGHGFTVDWAKQVEDETSRVRFGGAR